jgi:hypothetical protein
MAAVELVTTVSGPLAVDSAVTAADGRTHYQRVLNLSLPVNGAVQRLKVDSGTARLAGIFRSLDFDARESVKDAHAETSTVNGDTVVRLHGRWAVRRIEVASGLTGDVQLHRMDGDKVAGEPTVDRAPSDVTATFPTAGDAEFFDVRFAVRVGGSSIGPAELRRVGVRSYPTGARLGIAEQGQPETAELFWQSPGESHEPVVVSAGSAFAEALQRHVDARLESAGGTLGDSLQVALVAESDVPCTFELDTVGVTYAPTVEGFSDGPNKQVLRFSESEGFCHEVNVRVPAGAAIGAALVRMLPSFRHGVEDTSAAEVVNTPPTENTGVYMDTEHWVGLLVVPPDARPVRGLAVPLAPLRSRTRLRAELHTNAHGQPTGEVLRTADFAASPAGARAWITWTFQPALPPPAGGFWLLMTARQGAAVWLAEPGSGLAQVLLRSPRPGPFELESSVRCHKLLYQLIVAGSSTSADSVPPFSVAITDSPVAIVAAPIPADSTPNDERMIQLDLAPALSSYLVGPDAIGDPVEVPITFRSALPGIVTVYPPLIEVG